MPSKPKAVSVFMLRSFCALLQGVTCHAVQQNKGLQ
jgi:hypothetical protein